MFVDDDIRILEVFKVIFRKKFKVTVEYNPLKALELLSEGVQFDVIVSDIKMPEMTGIDFLLRAKHIAPLAARIVLTGHGDMNIAGDAVNLGHVYKFLHKPCRNDVLARAIEEAVEYGAFQKNANDGFIGSLLSALNFRNLETSAHVERVGRISATLAKTLGWTNGQSRDLQVAAAMHDIGKIGIPDAILLKPGRLSMEEFEVMKNHSRIGAEILRNSSHPVMEMAKDIASGHHERFDGRGYPFKIGGEDIPQSARIVAVADVYDALISDRVYRKHFEPQETLSMIVAERSKSFDKEVVDAMLDTIGIIQSFYIPLNSMQLTEIGDASLLSLLQRKD
jgi:putative two-component system response regulator